MIDKYKKGGKLARRRRDEIALKNDQLATRAGPLADRGRYELADRPPPKIWFFYRRTSTFVPFLMLLILVGTGLLVWQAATNVGNLGREVARYFLSGRISCAALEALHALNPLEHGIPVPHEEWRTQMAEDTIDHPASRGAGVAGRGAKWMMDSSCEATSGVHDRLRDAARTTR